MNDASDISRALADRAEALVIVLAAGRPVQKFKGQLRIGNRGALAVELRQPKLGIWHDHETGQGGDALDLVQHLMGGTKGDALRWARRWLNMPETIAQPVTQPIAEPAAPKSDAWKQIWRDAAPAAGAPPEAYLASRGLKLPAGAPLRFHPRCPRGADRLPAMIALMTDPLTGEPCGVHRTYIRPDGSGKADGTAKMMLGSAGLIKLTPDEEVTGGLGICEGIENGLAIMQLANWRPVWAAGSAGGIARFPVLAGIEALSVFADADDGGVGVQSAQQAAARWVAADREATVWTPPAGKDWLDALTARRAA